MERIGTLHLDGKELAILRGTYVRGGTALELMGDGEPWGRLTVRVPGAALAHDEIVVKTWEENAQIREPALACGLFEDTGRRVPCGFVQGEIWRIKTDGQQAD